MAPRDLARRLAYVPQSHAGLFAFTVEEVVLMGRTARIDYFQHRSRPGSRTPGPRHARHRSSGRARLYGNFGRRAATGADRPGAGTGGDHPDPRRTDRQPRFRQPVAGAGTYRGPQDPRARRPYVHPSARAMRCARGRPHRLSKTGRIVAQGEHNIASARSLADLYGVDERLVATSPPQSVQDRSAHAACRTRSLPRGRHRATCPPFGRTRSRQDRLVSKPVGLAQGMTVLQK